MKRLEILETPSDTMRKAQLGLRIAVCRRCAARPPSSEALGAEVPRTCEKQCELFNDLPLLIQTAHCVDPLVGSLDRVLEGHLQRLSAKPTSTGVEAERHAHRRRSWAEHTQRIIHVLKNLVHK